MRTLALVLCLLSPSLARAQSSMPELARQGAAALNSRRAVDFAALAAPGVDTAWVGNVTAAPDPEKRQWIAGTIDAGGQTWVVFSRDKMVEVDHDYLYRAAPSNGRWRLVASVDEAEPGRHWRITGHEESVTIDPEHRSARFTDVFRVRRLGSGWPFIFDLGYGYRIESLRVGTRPVSWTRAGNLIRVDAPVRSGATLHVVYSRTFQYAPGVRSNIFRHDALFYADWLPVISFQPAPSRITLDTPASWNSIAQGDLTSTKRRGNRITRTFTNVAPVSFIMAAAGQYRITRRTAHGYPLSTYMLTHDPDKSERGLATLAFALPFYAAHFGAIPWKHYTLVETSALQAMAQEGYSYSVYSTAMFPGASAHELGHSWWGGHVNNTYFGSYWNESLTTYSTDLVTAARRGELTAHATRIAEMRHYRAMTGGHDVPLMSASKTPWGPVTIGTTYEKGGMVCHMLRRELGDALFFRTLRRFAATYAGRAAEWDDLARIAGAEAHRPMGWFFEQWTQRPGGLRLRWTEVAAHPLDSGQTEVRAVLAQEGPPFRAHVEVGAEGSAGHAAARVWMAGPRTPVRLVVPGTPLRLIADPVDDLLRSLDPDELPPNTDTFYIGHHPLLIVYGTRGDARYRKAMRDQAEGQAASWRAINDGLFADLSGIKVVADTAVTEADRREAHLVLVGKPGTNAMMDEVADRLPVRFGAGGSVVIADRSLRGPDLVTVTNTRSPWNPERLLRTWSGNTPGAMALAWEESGGDVFSLMNTAWVVRQSRVLAWSDAGTQDRRTYVFPSARVAH